MHKRNKYSLLLFTSVILMLSMLAGCGPSAEDLAAVDYTPLQGGDWEVSSPEEEGLDPDLVAKMYYDASNLDTIYSLLIVKNGKLIAEKYFNEGSIDYQYNLQSSTKSYFSTWVGIALEQGCLTSLDQKLLEFFPEFVDQIEDPRKEEITIRHLLQMRSGYPHEESEAHLPERFFGGEGDWLPLIVDIPLTRDPGTDFQYTSFSTYLLGAIVAKACDTDLREFADHYLFSPTDTELGEFWQDNFGYYYVNVHVTARDAARFGQLYLDDGEYKGNQIISPEWVHDSLASYSHDVESVKTGPNFNKTGYGYQWWSLQSGEYHYNAALGHGGQVIAVLDEFDMVLVLTGDPFWLQWGGDAWKYERANKNLLGDFIASLPSE